MLATSPISRQRRWELLVVILGLAPVAFWVVLGGRLLQPSNIDWLMTGDDGGQHYLGWEFFRGAPLWQLPFGANPHYGDEISSSIVFTDSIPLMALLLKIISPLLPTPFQYHGIWLFVCFLLQGYFGYRLAAMVTPHAPLRFVGTALFLMAPIFLFRISVSHYASAAQWVVLAAICCYASTTFRARSWFALLLCASLVNVYLLVMACGIYVADLGRRLWCGERSLKPVVRDLTVAALACLATMWVAGYFMASKYTAGQGFGFYRMDILAPINPGELWSAAIPALPSAEGDFEGFAYLGLGVLLSIPFVLRGGQSLTARARQASFVVPIAVVGVGFALFALSCNIAIGGTEVASYPVPGTLWALAGTFRASGRFAWPLYYLVMCVTFGAVARCGPPRRAMLLAFVLFAIQMVDISGAVGELHGRIATAPAWQSPMKAELWEQFAARYDKIAVVLPAKRYDDYLSIGHFAVSHGMSTNGVYFARVHQEKLASATRRIRTEVLEGRYEPTSLYLFGDDDLWTAATSAPDRSDFVGVLDGFRVVAPGAGNEEWNGATRPLPEEGRP